MFIKILVTCYDSNGRPSIVPCIVECDENEYQNGMHYIAAKDCVGEEGYKSPYVCFDEYDKGYKDFRIQSFDDVKPYPCNRIYGA